MSPQDEQIKKEIIDIFYWDSRVDASNMNVTVDKGAVTLSGTVPDYSMRQAAVSDAWSARGTRSVDNKLTVESLIRRPEDRKTEVDVENVLGRLASIERGNIDISVDNGWLTLKGKVDRFWKKIRAEELASIIVGVSGVTNELVVVPTEKSDDREIGEAIMRSLERRENINETAIHVKVENGTVFLSGTVPSWGAKEDACKAAQHTVGVRDIQDGITVTPRP